MRNAKVVNHQYVSLLPPVEDQVLPYDIVDVGHVPIRDLSPITKACVEPDLHWTEKIEQEDL